MAEGTQGAPSPLPGFTRSTYGELPPILIHKPTAADTISVHRDYIEALEKHVATTKQRNSKLSLELDELEELAGVEIAIRDEEIANVRERLDNANSKVDELLSQATYKDDYERTKAHLDKQSDLLAQLEKDNETYRRMIDVKDTEITSLRANMESGVQMQVSGVEEKMGAEVARLQEEAKSSSGQLEGLQKELDVVRAEAEALREEVSRSRETLDEERRRLHEVLKEKDENIQQLTTDVNDLTEKLASLEDNHELKTSQHEALHEQMKAADEQLKEAKEMMEGELAEREQKMAAQSVLWKEEIDALKSVVEKKDSQLRTLERLSQSQRRASTVDGDGGGADSAAEVQRLTIELAAANAKVSGLESSAKGESGSGGVMMRDMRDSLSFANRRLQERTKEVLELQRELQALKDDIASGKAVTKDGEDEEAKDIAPTDKDLEEREREMEEGLRMEISVLIEENAGSRDTLIQKEQIYFDSRKARNEFEEEVISTQTMLDILNESTTEEEDEIKRRTRVEQRTKFEEQLSRMKLQLSVRDKEVRDLEVEVEKARHAKDLKLEQLLVRVKKLQKKLFDSLGLAEEDINDLTTGLLSETTVMEDIRRLQKANEELMMEVVTTKAHAKESADRTASATKEVMKEKEDMISEMTRYISELETTVKDKDTELVLVRKMFESTRRASHSSLLGQPVSGPPDMGLDPSQPGGGISSKKLLENGKYSSGRVEDIKNRRAELSGAGTQRSMKNSPEANGHTVRGSDEESVYSEAVVVNEKPKRKLSFLKRKSKS